MILKKSVEGTSSHVECSYLNKIKKKGVQVLTWAVGAQEDQKA